MMEMCYTMPAVMGHQGGKFYYTVNMSMRVLVSMLRIDDAGGVLDRSQRKVNPLRANAIAKYVTNNPKAYFLPGVIGVVEVPHGSELPKFEASEISGNVGVLKVGLDSIIKLFDGQHRATGIAKAIEKDPTIAQDCISITLYVGLSLQERQQAFTDINQNASKPPQGLSDTYNHRDPLSKVTMEMVENVEWLKDRVDFSSNTPSAQSEYLWSFKQIKDATAAALGTKTPSEQYYISAAYDFWGTMGQGMELGAFSIKQKSTSLLTTSVMLKALSSAFHDASADDGSVVAVRHWRAVNEKLSFSRNSADFIGRCVCPKTERMLSNADAVMLASNAILAAMGKTLDPVRKACEHKFFPPSP